MNKIFRGRRYDTETAQEVGVWDNDYFTNDLHYEKETLYRKRTGEYFLHGEGGAASKYAERCGSNGWGWGETIKPLSFEDAKEWAEEHLDGDEYEKIFGEVDETGEKQKVTLSLESSTMELLKRAAAKSGKTISEIVDELAKSL